ncbi:sarcosine oxidase subunit gamma [Rhodopseudomonas sp. P2A-2r]|uniref:sarcosine oxidase subunit gamma n=1 Tax=unclassified Rhodopseudomonas TaxID=2638247 RepID=UPI002234636F|nr:sarcosine oxidase subunit gamma family protein [Rhodopseudomonas sp. P2A-2r]UZE50772.1 sarcosine oxidase subunit gamma [Rhodopseudomonas sp. P2A-2r]
MADLTSISAFVDLPLPIVGRGLTVHERAGLGIATLMARKGKIDALAASIKEQYDIDLPSGPHWRGSDALALLGTGPGRWLAIHSAPPARFVANLAQQLEGVASVVDQSGACGVLRLSGPALIETLAKGVAIDLDAKAFPAGSVAVTQIAHVGVTLCKIDESPAIDVIVARSLSASFWHWLSSSAGASSFGST